MDKKDIFNILVKYVMIRSLSGFCYKCRVDNAKFYNNRLIFPIIIVD